MFMCREPVTNRERGIGNPRTERGDQVDELPEETGVGVAAAQSPEDTGEGLGQNKGGFGRDGRKAKCGGCCFLGGPKT